jgi:hypothetical protein
MYIALHGIASFCLTSQKLCLASIEELVPCFALPLETNALNNSKNLPLPRFRLGLELSASASASFTSLLILTMIRDENYRKLSGNFPETLGSETFPNAVLSLLFSLKRQILQFLVLGRRDLFIQ